MERASRAKHRGGFPGKKLMASMLSLLLCAALVPTGALADVSEAWADEPAANQPAAGDAGSTGGTPSTDQPGSDGSSSDAPSTEQPTTPGDSGSAGLPNLPHLPGIGNFNPNDTPGLSDFINGLRPGGGTGATPGGGSGSSPSVEDQIAAVLANEVYALYYRNGTTDTYTVVLQRGSQADPALGTPVETQTGFVCNEMVPTPRCVCRAWKSSLDSKVTALVVKDVIAPHVTSYWFANMTACASMDLAKLDMAQVTDMSGMFSGCASMAELDLSTFNLAKTPKMDNLFPLRSAVLTTIKVPAKGAFANVLPAPNPWYLQGATGKWVNQFGDVFATTAIPANTAATYTAQRGYSIDNGYIEQTKYDYSYTGSAIKPQYAVHVAGHTLKVGTDYTLSYQKNKAIGMATLVATGKGNYSGQLTCTFRINPQNVKSVALKRGKKSVTVKWKKRSGQSKLLTGYEVRVSTDKAASKVKAYRVVKKPAASSVTIKNLKAKKTYYVTMRTYKKIGSRYYFSTWSKPRAVKTK